MHQLKIVDLDFRRQQKNPPCDLEAESSLLGAILLDPGAMARVEQIVSPDAFYLAGNREIFQVMQALYLEDLPTDLTSVSRRVKHLGLTEKIGGTSYLLQLLDAVVSSVHAEGDAKAIADCYRRRQYFRLGQQVCMDAYDMATPLEQAQNRIEGDLMGLSLQKRQNRMVDLADGLIETVGEIEQRAAHGIPPGLTTGYYDLDMMTQGFQRGDLIIMAGRPSMGKSAAALNIARNVAGGPGNHPVLIFSLEDSRSAVECRLLSIESQIEAGRLKAGRLREDDWEAVGHATAFLSSLPITIDDTPGISLSEIRSKARLAKSKRGELGLIVIDYLQLMDAGENRVQGLGAITRGLKELARSLEVPIILLSQLSRAVEQRGDKRPMLSDLRDSGEIEQDGDLVVMLYRDEYYNPETVDRGIAEWIVAKHRNGPTGTVKLLFEKEFTQFKNLARRYG